MQFLTASLGLLLATQASALEYKLFSDGNCQNYIQSYDVFPNTCASPWPGWSSMQLEGPGTPGTLTAYTTNSCGCPTCGSHGYDATDTGCLMDFGFVANAMGFNAIE